MPLCNNLHLIAAAQRHFDDLKKYAERSEALRRDGRLLEDGRCYYSSRDFHDAAATLEHEAKACNKLWESIARAQIAAIALELPGMPEAFDPPEGAESTSTDF